jgi:uncharacterized membrane protein YgaE (UPF0421/DUF939 family)
VNVCAIGSTRMDVRVVNVNIRWDFPFIMLVVRTVNVYRNHDGMMMMTNDFTLIEWGICVCLCVNVLMISQHREYKRYNKHNTYVEKHKIKSLSIQ